MAKKAAAKSSRKSNPKLTRAASAVAARVVRTASKSIRNPAKRTIKGRVKATVAKPFKGAKVVVHDAGIAAATAVGAAMGVTQAVKDLVGRKPKRRTR